MITAPRPGPHGLRSRGNEHTRLRILTHKTSCDAVLLHKVLVWHPSLFFLRLKERCLTTAELHLLRPRKQALGSRIPVGSFIPPFPWMVRLERLNQSQTCCDTSWCRADCITMPDFEDFFSHRDLPGREAQPSGVLFIGGGGLRSGTWPAGGLPLAIVIRPRAMSNCTHHLSDQTTCTSPRAGIPISVVVSRISCRITTTFQALASGDGPC